MYDIIRGKNHLNILFSYCDISILHVSILQCFLKIGRYIIFRYYIITYTCNHTITDSTIFVIVNQIYL